jgi:murein DD-endopeptidase MepM/ murein hydrolase activator NlpD
MMSLVVGTRISSPFGLRTHPILGFLEFHKGMDIAAAAGSPIHVVTSGVIEGAGPKGSYGLWVKIRHSLDYETAYAHLSAFAEGIRPGVMVFAGDEIGKVGSTGMSTGPHLHLEWIYRGTPINPACPAPAQISLSQPFGKRLTGASSRQKNFTRTTTKSRQRRLYEKRK